MFYKTTREDASHFLVVFLKFAAESSLCVGVSYLCPSYTQAGGNWRAGDIVSSNIIYNICIVTLSYNSHIEKC